MEEDGVELTPKFVNIAIKELVKKDRFEEGLEFFNYIMREYEIEPNIYTYTELLKVYKGMKLPFDQSQTLFNEIQEKGIKPDAYFYTVLLENVAIPGFVNVELAKEIVKDMRKQGTKPTLVTYQVLVRIARLSSDKTAAIEFFEDIERHHLIPNTRGKKEIQTL